MNWHAACTCKMDMAYDTMAVVDSKARVIGVKNLRVVDASAFALLTPGHLNHRTALPVTYSADFIHSSCNNCFMELRFTGSHFSIFLISCKNFFLSCPSRVVSLCSRNTRGSDSIVGFKLPRQGRLGIMLERMRRGESQR